MTHYAKMATFGFRFLAVAALLHSIPGLVAIMSIGGMANAGLHMPMWPLASVLLYPIVAVIVFVFARPLGELVARGLE
jgi:hypothetical protein